MNPGDAKWEADAIREGGLRPPTPYTQAEIDRLNAEPTNPPTPDGQGRWLVDPPRGSDFKPMTFDNETLANAYAEKCPSHTRIVDRRLSVALYDPVNHPSHYTSHPSGIECIQITRHMNFNLGNALKYIWRAGAKNSTIQDLEKARWYINDEIERLKNAR